MTSLLVVGNPKPSSRTRAAGERLLAALGFEDPGILELAELGPKLLGWGDPDVAAAVAAAQRADLVVFASPTFKASYTGLLKLYLDQVAGGTGLAGTVAVPLMLTGAPGHALAVEYTLKPVLAEIGATCPTPGLSLIDSTFETDGVLEAWAERWRDPLTRLIPA